MAAMADKHHVGESSSLPEGGRLHVKIQVSPVCHVSKLLASSGCSTVLKQERTGSCEPTHPCGASVLYCRLLSRNRGVHC